MSIDRFPISLEASLPPVCAVGMTSFLRLKIRNNCEETADQVVIKIISSALVDPVVWHRAEGLPGHGSDVSDFIDFVPIVSGKPKLNYEVSVRCNGQIKEARSQSVDSDRLNVIKAAEDGRSLQDVINDVAKYAAISAESETELGNQLAALPPEKFQHVALMEKGGRTLHQTKTAPAAPSSAKRAKTHPTHDGPSSRQGPHVQRIPITTQPNRRNEALTMAYSGSKPVEGAAPPQSHRVLSPNRPPVTIAEQPMPAPTVSIEAAAEPPKSRRINWVPWLSAAAIAIIVLVLFIEQRSPSNSAASGTISNTIPRIEPSRSLAVSESQNPKPIEPEPTAESPRLITPPETGSSKPSAPMAVAPTPVVVMTEPPKAKVIEQNRVPPQTIIPASETYSSTKVSPFVPPKRPAVIEPMELKRTIVFNIALNKSTTSLMAQAKDVLSSQDYESLLAVKKRAESNPTPSYESDAARFVRLYYAAADYPTLFCAPNIDIEKSWHNGRQIAASELERIANPAASNRVVSGPKVTTESSGRMTVETEIEHITNLPFGEDRMFVFDILTIETGPQSLVITKIAGDNSKLSEDSQLRNLARQVIRASESSDTDSEIACYASKVEKYFDLVSPTKEEIRQDIETGVGNKNGEGRDKRKKSWEFKISNSSIRYLSSSKREIRLILDQRTTYLDDGSTKKISHIIVMRAVREYSDGNFRIYFHDRE